MKRIIAAILMAAMLLMVGTSGLCEEPTTFNPMLTDMMEADADQLMADSMTRALVTVTLALDLSVAMDDDSKQVSLSDVTYVGRSGSILNVLYHIQDKHGECIFVSYAGGGRASYIFMHGLTDEFAPGLMASVCKDGYFRNSIDDLATALEEVGKIFGA